MRQVGRASLRGALGLAVGLLVAAPAQAAQIVFSDVDGFWTDPQPVGVDIVTNFDGVGVTQNDFISWGTNPPTNVSQYIMNLDNKFLGGFAPTDGVPFEFAEFTHDNREIGGVLLEEVTYELNFNSNGIPAALGPRRFVFAHNETDNSCTNPGPGDPPLPPGVNDCSDDIVTITSVFGTITDIMVGDWLWDLELLGFEENGVFSNQFISPENGTSSARLFAVATSSHPVPEPQMLFLVGVAALFVGERVRALRK